MNVKIYLVIFSLSALFCFSIKAEDGPFLRVRNNSDQEITLLISSSKKYLFADLKRADVSQYKPIDTGYHAPSIEVLPGESHISGKAIKIDSQSLLPLESGYYTYILTARAGTFSILCIKDATVMDLGKTRDHLAPEAIPPLGNEFLIVDGIKKPGKYHLEPNAKLTLSDAIKLAGGALDGNWEDTAVAALCDIHLMRYVNGKVENYRLDASDRKGVMGKDCDFLIKPGDKIIVPVYF